MSAVDEVIEALYPPDEAERSYVAALLQRDDANEAMWRSKIEVQHFLSGEYGALYEAMLAVRDRGKRVGYLTVAEELANVPLETLMWNSVNGWTNPEYVEFFAEQMLARYRRRIVDESGTALRDIAAATPGPDMDAAIDATIANVMDTGATHTGAKPAPIRSAAFDPADDGAVLDTPWPVLNRAIRGLIGGGLYVLSGDTGSGKSAVALQLASAMALHGPCIYHSMEMTAREQTQRLIAQRTGIALRMVQTQHYPEGPVRDRIESFVRDADVQVVIDDRAGLNVSEIRRQALATDGLAGIVVDQLSLMDLNMRKTENLADAIARTTKALKILAVDLRVPIILLSQLNREAARAGKPSRHHLYGSSAIANDSDVIVIIYREDARQPENVQLLIDKNRQGEEGILDLRWQGEFVRLVE